MERRTEMETFRRRFLGVMDYRRMSYLKLEGLCGIGRTQLSRYGLGKICPRADSIAKIAKALDVSVDFLMGLTDECDATSWK